MATTTGTGVLLPFKRDGKGDFAKGSGDETFRSRVRLVLGTKGDTPVAVGELPYRTAFGAGLDVLRFQPLNEATAEIARSLIRQAFTRWLPSLQLVDVKGRREGQKLTLLVRYKRRGGADTYTERRTI